MIYLISIIVMFTVAFIIVDVIEQRKIEKARKAAEEADRRMSSIKWAKDTVSRWDRVRKERQNPPFRRSYSEPTSTPQPARHRSNDDTLIIANAIVNDSYISSDYQTSESTFSGDEGSFGGGGSSGSWDSDSSSSSSSSSSGSD